MLLDKSYIVSPEEQDELRSDSKKLFGICNVLQQSIVFVISGWDCQACVPTDGKFAGVIESFWWESSRILCEHHQNFDRFFEISPAKRGAPERRSL